MNFPNPPWTDGQVSGNYVYSTARGLWESKPLTGPKSTYGVQPPLNPQLGDEWINSNDMTAFGWYIDTDGGQWVEKTASISANGYYSPNYIINGGFDIWQRGTGPFTGGAGGYAYSADRFAVFRDSSQLNYSLSQITSADALPTGAKYAARIRRTAGDTGVAPIFCGASFEGASTVTQFAGQTMTLSLYARAGASFNTAGLTLYFESGTGTDTAFTVASTGAVQSSKTITLTSSWVRYSLTFTVNSSHTTGRYYIGYTPVGTAGANDYFDIWGVQLESGSVATPFRRNANSLQGELAACQRYYWRTALGQYARIAWTIAKSGTGVQGMITLPTQMRVTPYSLDSSASGTFGVYDGVTLTQTTSVPTLGYTAGSNPQSAQVDFTTGAITQYRSYELVDMGYSNAYIGFNAEL